MILYFIIASLIFLVIHYRFYWKVSGGNRFQDTTPFFISHRGFKAVYPENTINAFKHAEEVGFHWIELDVVVTKDGHVVCSHNFDLEKETDGFGYINSLNRSDVNSVNQGDRTKSSGNFKIPGLIDVFKKINKSTRVNIEVKSPYATDLSTARALSKIMDMLPQERLIISSFNPFVILYFKVMHRDVVTGFLYQNIEYLWFVNWIHPSYIHPRVDLIDKDLIAYAKSKNLGINAWTVNNISAIEWCKSNNIDGIITDLEVVK
jgi:glycerophosphoryl diester phosphodiesterase